MNRDTLVILLKKLFRNVYYFFREGKISIVHKPQVLFGYKWIESKSNGRAYSKGYYEQDLQRCLHFFLNGKSVFFDIGGHAGYISLLASRYCKSVYTFEPEPSNYSFIQQIIRLNNITNVDAIASAVGRQPGILKLEKGLSSSMGKISEKGTIEVSVTSVDDFVKKKGIEKIDLIKIDVEGFGAEVLTGMADAIKKWNPVIFYELHNNEEFDAFKKLKKQGYFFFTSSLEGADLNQRINEFLVAVHSTQLAFYKLIQS
jgi:FkbM family methyltransferase